jgi:hypothetical protein
MPETTRELLPLLELIEKAPPNTAPKGGDNAKGKSTQGGGAAKKRSADTSDLKVPCKKAHLETVSHTQNQYSFARDGRFHFCNSLRLKYGLLHH